MEQNNKRNWLLWVLLIFLPPFGILYMWIAKKEFSQKKKKTLSIIFAIWFLFCLGVNSNQKAPVNVADNPPYENDKTTVAVSNNEMEKNILSENEEFPESEKITNNEESSPEDIIGRGNSDFGRSEPQYENISGYVVVYDSYPLIQDDIFPETPWTVPIYEKDKQFWVECGVIDHKTEVTVISQQLEHMGYGTYSGYLLVERLDNNEQFYISVKNFITKPYWTYDDLEEATSIGYYIAEFNQISNYYPVTKKNEKVELDDKTKVLVIGRTGSYGRGGPDRNTNSIEAVVFKDWKYGYGGVSVFFNQNDLSIIY